VADYLFQPDVLKYWLGRDALLCPEGGSHVRLPHATLDDGGRIRFGAPLEGKVVSLSWPRATLSKANDTSAAEYQLQVAVDASQGGEHVRFQLSPRPGGGCRLRIAHSGLATDAKRHASVRLWQGALNRVARLMVHADRARRHERQAVIVVHGIGEQRPGQLLRQFVANIFDRDAGELHFVKPDQVSSLFEMRMATVPRKDVSRPTTDVYELYWAHLIRDTSASQVYGWVLRLIFSRDTKIPRSLIRLVWCLRIGLIVAAGVAAWLTSQDIAAWIKGLGIALLAALPAVAKLLLGALRDEYIVGYAGDAARYLEPRPENIARRQAIREAGAKLIDALHDKGRYARIMVYGHSLGSIIAYDILSHAWAQRSRQRVDTPRTDSRALRRLEALLSPRAGQAPTPSVDDVQALQYAAWLEYQKNGFQWKVSDFVTAGSPLAHATWLLNLDARTQFTDLVRERSFPTCPPQTEAMPGPVPEMQQRVFTFTHAYPNPQNRRASRSVQVPHHGGLFALTRWTNLYFPYRRLYDGDPIGGALAPQFGTWIKDMSLGQVKGFAHGRYTDRTVDPSAAAQVRIALNLPMRRPLSDYAPTDLHPTVLQ
jgi:hypothetical protein